MPGVGGGGGGGGHTAASSGSSSTCTDPNQNNAVVTPSQCSSLSNCCINNVCQTDNSPCSRVFAIIGIVFGVIAVISIALCCYCCQRQQSNQQAQNVEMGNLKAPLMQGQEGHVAQPYVAQPYVAQPYVAQPYMPQAPQPALTIQIQVPADKKPGSQLIVYAPDGRQLQVIVPEGVVPGESTMQVQFPQQ
jgi:hypothetical protein